MARQRYRAVSLLVLFLLLFSSFVPITPGAHALAAPTAPERAPAIQEVPGPGPGGLPDADVPVGEAKAPAAPTGGGPRVIVRYREGVQAAQAAPTPGRTLAKTVLGAGAPAELVELPAGADIEQALKELESRPDVLYAEPNYPVRAFQTPDPLYGRQWGLENVTVTDGVYGIAAAPAWEALTTAGESQRQAVVAVVDTGVDKDHEDLAGRLVTAGYNAITNTGNETAWDDDNGHGTHVAGIIAATYDNAIGIAGVAGPANVKVLPVKALDNQGSGSIFDVARGISWAADHGARVINLSLGTNYYSQTLDEAVEYALDRGVLVVAAAGNEEGPVDKVYPASLPGVVAVAASNREGDICDFSNYGPGIDLAAPGEAILSTYPEELDTEDGGQDGYTELDGTSMAAPFVAGLAGLLLTADDSLTAGDVQAILKDTALDLGDPGRDEQYGYGLINAAAALNKALGNGMPKEGFSVTITSPAPGVNIVGTTTIAATVSGPGQTVAVDVYLDSTTGTFIKTLMQTVYGAYSFNWTPAIDDRVASGPHTIDVVAKDAEGSVLGQDSVRVNIVKDVATGLALHVLTPDAGDGAQPAGSAQVYVFEAERTGNDVNYSEVFSGVTDLQGDIRIPSTTAPDGKEYLVTVNGLIAGSGDTDGRSSWFFYARTFDTADPGQRGRQTIDGGQALKLTPSLLDGEAPIALTSGRILVQPSEMLADDQPITALGASWQAADGPASFWVDPGTYSFILAGENDQAAYYLELPAGVTAGGPLTFTVPTTPVDVGVATTGSVSELKLYVKPWSDMYAVAPQEVDDEEDVLDLRNKPLYITPGDYHIEFSVGLHDSSDNSDWAYVMEPRNNATGEEQPWTVAEGESTLTLGENLTGVAFAGEDNEYYPGGDFYFYPVVRDALGFTTYAIGKNDDAVDLSSARILDDRGSVVVDGITVAPPFIFSEAYYLAVSGSFSEQLANGNYTFVVDVPVGPLGTGENITAESTSFTVDPVPTDPPQKTIAEATVPQGEVWAGSTYVRLWLYETAPGGSYQLRYFSSKESNGTQALTFTSSEPLGPGKSFYAVLTGISSGSTNENVVVYSRPVAADADGIIHLAPAATTRQARLRSFASDGGEWDAGSADLKILVNMGGRQLGDYDGTVQFRPIGQRNMYIDDGTYDMVTTSWVSSGGTPLYNIMGALNDVQVDASTTTDNETRLKVDVTNGPHITLQPDEPVDGWLDLVVTPAGIDQSIYWEESDITNVPTYFTSGTYQMLMEYDPLDDQGSWPEGDWWYDLVPAAADADGNVTLLPGQSLEWGLGGGFTTTVDMGEQDSYYPGDTLTITAGTVDSHGNRLVYVGSDDEEIWYDRAQVTARPQAVKDEVPTPIDRQAKAVLRYERSGGGLVARAVNKDGVQALSHNNSPVFLIRRDADQAVTYRDSSEAYFKQVKWTVPQDAVGGNYTAQYLVSIDGAKVFEQAKTIQIAERRPTTPTNLQLTAKTSTYVSLAWDASAAPSGIKEYVVQMKTGTGTPTEIGRTTETSFTKTGLTPATTYTFQVQAISNAGLASAWSSELSVTTDPAGGGSGGDGGAGGGGGGGGGGGSSRPVPTPAPPENTVTPAGGQLTLADGQVTLDFTAGSFAAPVQIKVTQEPALAAPPAHLQSVAPVFTLDAGNAQTAKAFQAGFRYQERLLGEQDPLTVGVYRREGTGWQYVGGRLNRAQGTIEVQLSALGTYTLLAARSQFTDTAGHWAASAVNVLGARGIIGGTGNGTFQPEGTVTRAQVAKLLVSALGQRWENPVRRVTPVKPTFSDVVPTAWYYSYVETATAAGLFRGYADGTFRPDESISREEVTAVLLRALGVEAPPAESAFEDNAAIAPWARPAVAEAYRRGLVRGITPTAFGPQETTSRAQAATLVYRLAERAGILETVTPLTGRLVLSLVEGKHYELEVNGERYVLLVDPDNAWLQEALAGAVGQGVTLRGIFQAGADQYQRGPVLRLLDLEK